MRRPPGGRAPFERLESRLLLSGIPSQVDFSYPIVPVSAGAMLVIGSPHSELPTPSSFSTSAGQVAPSTVAGAQTTALPTNWPARVAPVIAMVGGAMEGGTSTEGMIAVVSPSTGDLGEGSITPVVVMTTSGDATSGLATGGGALSSASPSSDGQASSFPATGGAGAHETWDAPPGGGLGVPVSGDSSGLPHSPTVPGVPPPSVPSSLPSSASDGESPSLAPTGLPETRHVEVVGSLDEGHDYLTVQIPVGPTTRELGLSIQGETGTNAGQGPVLGQMSLVDRDGDTLARLGPIEGSPGSGPSDAVTLALDDVPVGGTLLVQIAAPAGVTGGMTSARTNASTASAWTLPFVMDVQRLESAASGTSAAASSLVGTIATSSQTRIGALAGASDPQDQGSPEGGAEADAGAGNAVVTTAIDPGEATQAADESSGVETASPADLSGRLATGPLAGRTAAALGPNLSSLMLDPAPAIDRHERALSQEIAPDDDDLTAVVDPSSSVGDPDEDPGESGGRSLSPRESVVSIAGIGPLPLKISAAGSGGRGGELGALQAALADTPRRSDGLAGILAEDRVEDPILAALTRPASTDGDHRPNPDYLASACILALGMGLVTGPIIPDLLRLMPTRSSRWRAIRGMGAGPAADGGDRARRFGSWLGRRIGR